MKERVGVVVSDKMDKTVVVEVTRRVPHAKYGKIIKITKKFYAHDEKDTAKLGNQVRIVETRPISKTKRWKVKEVIL